MEKSKKRGRKAVRHSLKRQMLVVFLAALLVPYAVIGFTVTTNVVNQMEQRYREQTDAEQTRVSSILFDMTMTVYNTCNDLVNELSLPALMSGTETVRSSVLRGLDERLNNEQARSPILEDLELVTDNPAFSRFGRVIYTPDLSAMPWHEEVADSAFCHWLTVEKAINRLQVLPCLTLVVRINTARSPYQSYLVAYVSYNYLNNRTDTTEYFLMMATAETGSFFSSTYRGIGTPLPVAGIDGLHHLRFQGDLRLGGEEAMASLSSFTPYATSSKIYVLAADTSAHGVLRFARLGFALMLLLCFAIPFAIIMAYARVFSRRVGILRDSMHQISQGNYEMPDELTGDDELGDTFRDLQATTRQIQARDQAYYEEQMRNQELLNKQQQIEYKMLESQINPHFLYNTLEMIRMQAIGHKDYEVGSSVMLLAKSMLYVLESYHKEFTTLAEELAHVEKYLEIQRLRFGSRVNWKLYIDEAVDAANYPMLPLLLQPIVENAIVHGLEGLKREGHISIIAEETEAGMALSVTDNGSGMDADALRQLLMGINDTRESEARGSIGVKNTHQRIVLFYGKEYGIRITSERDKGTQVTLLLPRDPVPFFAEKAGREVEENDGSF